MHSERARIRVCMCVCVWCAEGAHAPGVAFVAFVYVVSSVSNLKEEQIITSPRRQQYFSPLPSPLHLPITQRGGCVCWALGSSPVSAWLLPFLSSDACLKKKQKAEMNTWNNKEWGQLTKLGHHNCKLRNFITLFHNFAIFSSSMPHSLNQTRLSQHASFALLEVSRI